MLDISDICGYNLTCMLLYRMSTDFAIRIVKCKKSKNTEKMPNPKYYWATTPKQGIKKGRRPFPDIRIFIPAIQQHE